MLKRLGVAAGVLGLIVGVGGVVAAPSDASKDWPQWRGHNRDSISKETGLLKQWPRGGPPRAWKADQIGNGYSSVAVANGKIFTAGEMDGSTYAIALNESDGKEAWKTKIGPAGDPANRGAGPRATPTVDGDRVYMVGQLGDVSCMNAADGKEVWHAHMNKEYGGETPKWGNSDSLLIEGDKVLCTAGAGKGTVVALNKMTGKEVWVSKDLKEPIHYVPLIAVDLAGARQIIASTQNTVAGLSPKDGSVLWKIARKGQTAVIPTPIVHNDHVYVTAGYGQGDHLFKVTSSGGRFTASEVYSTKNMMNHHGGVILLDGNVYGHSDGKGWVCQDLMSGEIKWADRQILGKGAIAYADGHFYLRDENSGRVVLIEANPSKVVEKGRFEQPERSRKSAWPHPVIANGKLYLRDQENLFCYDVKAK
jgi:outer membrane protein assembly factor BamB